MTKVFTDSDALARIIAGLRSQGKTVVLAPGVFDLLHVGHARLLLDARTRGDYLIVALQGDAAVKKAKGAGRPLQPAAERAEVLSSFGHVSYVTFFHDADASGLCRSIQPDVLVRGRDYSEKTIPERVAAADVGCRLAIVGDSRVWSTDQILGRTRKGGKKASTKSAKKSAKKMKK